MTSRWDGIVNVSNVKSAIWTSHRQKLRENIAGIGSPRIERSPQVFKRGIWRGKGLELCSDRLQIIEGTVVWMMLLFKKL